jgi:hypothetical protein
VLGVEKELNKDQRSGQLKIKTIADAYALCGQYHAKPFISNLHTFHSKHE